MSVPPRICLAPMKGTTQFAPLVAMGFFMREFDLLAPIYSRLVFEQATHTQYPVEALLDLWVSILAGCRSVWQINTKIRPDLTLAQAWGRSRFADPNPRLPECWTFVSRSKSSNWARGSRRCTIGGVKRPTITGPVPQNSYLTLI